ncbi:hypothetical protein [Citrobacter sp. FP75]|uniref:hypothetical protein n=1 Tax=Citrobacter sp. FP75 TaxID=1852949 RepID=UPI001BC9F01F|nr:hypothetical protein [Citrobacter sp. FP75]
MKMNKGIVIWSLIALAIVTPLLVATYIQHQRKNFSCEIHTTIVYDNSVLDMILDFNLNNGNGTYEAAGEYNENGAPTQSVSNKVSFKYWYEDGQVIMVSDEANPLPKKDEFFRQFIPDFFQHRNRGVRFQITPVNAISYIFTYDDAPVFYCSKN